LQFGAKGASLQASFFQLKSHSNLCIRLAAARGGGGGVGDESLLMKKTLKEPVADFEELDVFGPDPLSGKPLI